MGRVNERMANANRSSQTQTQVEAESPSASLHRSTTSAETSTAESPQSGGSSSSLEIQSDTTTGIDQQKGAKHSSVSKQPTAQAKLEGTAGAVPANQLPVQQAVQQGTEAADDLLADWNNQVYAPIKHLTETPGMFFEPFMLAVLLKFAIAVLLLGSHIIFTAGSQAYHVYESNPLLLLAFAAAGVVVAAVVTPLLLPAGLVLLAAVGVLAAVVLALSLVGVAIFFFLPGLYRGVILTTIDTARITLKQLHISLVQQRLDHRPKLASNPMYALARLVGVLGPGPIVLALDLLLLPLFLLMAPVTWPALFIEPVALVALFFFMPPFIIGGLVDHSMVEYYSACVLSSDADWTPYGQTEGVTI
jgi:hypothetical protein